MSKVYTAVEAREKWRELLEEVGHGEVVTITEGGRVVAEVRPVGDAEDAAEARIEELRRQGRISGGGGPRDFTPVAERPGALQRFLDERE